MVVKLHVFIILAVIIPLWIFLRSRKYLSSKDSFNGYREFVVNLLFVYILVVGYLTLKPFHFTVPMLGPRQFTFDVNLFYHLRHMASSHFKHQVLYSGGNIMMFVPFGVLAPLLFRFARHFLGIVLLGFFFSLTIELTQATFTTYRTGTVDDLFFNTLGAALGFGIFLLLKLSARRIAFMQRLIDI